MARVIIDGLWVCQDCAMMIANGELGQGDVDAEARHIERMTAHMGTEPDTGVSWSAWLVLNGCDDESHVETGCDCMTDEFSWSGCDACGDALAGDRFSACVIR